MGSQNPGPQLSPLRLLFLGLWNAVGRAGPVTGQWPGLVKVFLKIITILKKRADNAHQHAAAVVGNKMVVVGGEIGGILDTSGMRSFSFQVLNFDSFSWTTASSKLYLSPTSLPLKIPACKGHALVQWGKKILMVGGKTDPASDKVSVWPFDTETECWSLLEVKGDVPVARSGHTVLRASSVLILFGGEDGKRRKLNDLHMFDLKSLTWSHGCHFIARELLRDISFISLPMFLLLGPLILPDGGIIRWHGQELKYVDSILHLELVVVECSVELNGHAETLIFDVLKLEWFVAVASPSSSITTNKVEPINGTSTSRVDSIARHNLSSAVEHHGYGRKSLSESLLIDPSSVSGNVSLRKQFSNDKDAGVKMTKTSGNESPSQIGKEFGLFDQFVLCKGSLRAMVRQTSANFFQDTDDFVFQEGDYKAGLPTSLSSCQQYEAKLSALIRKNGIIGQLAAALDSHCAAEKNLSSALKSKQEMEKKMADAVKEMELLKEKLASVELTQEKANSLSNIVLSDNVTLEHDMAFL
ncbi:hypothetical protein RND71_007947 [Anisodus tanguticus]|uniref:Acyl-CoA-binding domain-containing protein 4 n=1 Tax=Anisodus tanguticus TaxID=243964 RepID=A0AAE1VJJ2_9SOLA|nr:hypothetical protein RND71_007947 [Anisodus tanguticus]